MTRPIQGDNLPELAIIFPWDGKKVDRLEAMTTLLAVVDAGSFSAASRKLRVPVTTVSRRVAELETLLRTQLLQRTTRRLSLTDAGVPYVLACRQILEEIEEAERTASGEYQSPRGKLTITAPAMLGRIHMVPIIAEFMAQYADIQMTCHFSDRVLDMQAEHVDVAVRIGELPESRHRARRIGTIHRLVAASPGYLDRYGEPRTPDDLSDHECVAFHGFDPPGRWLFPNGAELMAVPIRSRVTFDTTDAVIEAGLAGIGLIRLFCYHIMLPLRTGRLREVLSDHVPPGVPVNILYNGEGLVPLKVRSFIDFCAPRLESALIR